MEGHIDSDYGKMGMGVIRYLQNPIIGIIDKSHAGKKMNELFQFSGPIPIYESLQQVEDKEIEVLILGIAPSGGKSPDSWVSVIDEALEMGLSIINGLHDLLQPQWQHKIKFPKKQWIWDVRVPQFTPPIASGKAAKLNNKRVLFVGTDMAIGKMTAALELYQWLINENQNVGFVATGQIGITITGQGIPLDAFKVDHACGAVEKAVMEQSKKNIVLIEGQGSLLHPGSTATLPLMRGSSPTHLILCHGARKTHLRSPKEVAVPDLKSFIMLHENLCSVIGTYPEAKVVGIALNTSDLTDSSSKATIAQMEDEIKLPVQDVVRFGAEKLASQLI